MNRRLTAIAEREGDGYFALYPEVDVASQGATATEAQTLFFETASASDIDRHLKGEVYITNKEVAIGKA